jgi:hypothetical protein
MLVKMESDIKGSTKDIKRMVREFIIMQMEIREKDIGKMINNMGMLYFISEGWKEV